MNALKIQVKNGRLSFDEPTELPEGTTLELVEAPAEGVHQARPSQESRTVPARLTPSSYSSPLELRPSLEEPKNQLLWEEIKALHPDEWVVLVDLLYNDDRPEYETKRVIGGVVFDHHSDRKVVGQRTREALYGKLAAVFFTGEAYLRKPR